MKSIHPRQIFWATLCLFGTLNVSTTLPTVAQNSPSTPDSQLPPASPTTPNSPTTPSSSPQTPTTPTRSTTPTRNNPAQTDSDTRTNSPSQTTSPTQPTTPKRSTYPNRRNNSTKTTSPTRTNSPSQTTTPTRPSPSNRSTNYNTPNNSTNTNSPTRPTSPSTTTSPTPRSANPQPQGLVQTIALQQSSSTQTQQPGSASLNSVDRQFATKAAQSDMTEIQTSQLALNRSQNPQVLKYAQEMIQAHTDSTAKLKPIVAQLNLAMPKTLGAENQAYATQLSRLSGTQFDLAYTTGQARAHARTQAVFQTELQQGKNPQLKAFATEILPVVSMHLQMAKQLTAMR